MASRTHRKDSQENRKVIQYDCQKMATIKIRWGDYLLVLDRKEHEPFWVWCQNRFFEIVILGHGVDVGSEHLVLRGYSINKNQKKCLRFRTIFRFFLSLKEASNASGKNHFVAPGKVITESEIADCFDVSVSMMADAE